MAWSLVCPASRGIGFHLVRHLLENTKLPVVATARNNVEGVRESILKDTAVTDKERLTVLEVDVTDESTIAHASSQAKSLFPPSSHHLHLAFCLPGILYPEKSPSQLTHQHLTHTFAINTIAPLLLIKHFSPLLPTVHTSQTSDTVPPHAVWLNMAARVGSTSDNSLGGWYSYRASKAAVMSLTKTFDLFLKVRSGREAMAVAYHPGTVRTGLSRDFWGREGMMEPEVAVERMVRVIGEGGLERRGRCWDWRGEEVLP